MWPGEFREKSTISTTAESAERIVRDRKPADGLLRSFVRRQVQRAIPDATFFRHAARLISGTVVAQLIVVLSTPIVTRLYTPDDFGRLGLFLSFLSIAGVTASLKYEAAIVSADSDRDAGYLLLNGTLISLLSAVGAGGVLYGMIRLNVLGFERLSAAIVILMVPTLVVTSLYASVRQWAVRLERFGGLSRALITQSAGRTLTQIGLGMGTVEWYGLIIGEIFGRVLGIIRLVRYGWKSWINSVLPIRRADAMSVARRYFHFPKFCLPSGLINSLALSLPVPLIILNYGAVAGGAFVVVQRILSLPLTMIGSGVSDAFQRRMVTHSETSRDQSLKFLNQTALRLLCLGVVPAVVIATAGPALMTWALGENWGVAGSLAAAMAPWALAQLAVSPLSRVLSVYRAYTFKLVYDVLSLLNGVCIIMLSARNGISLIAAVQILSWANVAAYIVYFFLLRHVVARGGR